MENKKNKAKSSFNQRKIDENLAKTGFLATFAAELHNSITNQI